MGPDWYRRGPPQTGHALSCLGSGGGPVWGTRISVPGADVAGIFVETVRHLDVIQV